MTDIQIRPLVAQPTAAVRVRTTMAEIAAQFGRYLPAIAQRLEQDGDTPSGPPYARYHQFDETGVDVEIGLPLQQPAALPALADVAAGDIGASELPAGDAAVAVHRGPYDELMKTYDAIGRWLAEHGREAPSAPWEWYVDDPETTDPAELRTEVVWPLA